MYKFLNRFVLSLLVGTCFVGVNGLSAHMAEAKTTFVTIGTGGITGVYYPTGGAIAMIINDRQDTLGIKATAEATGASVFNINAVGTGDLDFGIAQADRQYQAYEGLSEWGGRPVKDLRAMFSLAPEMVTLVVAEDSGIKKIEDVKGKVINIGNPGSGNRQNAIDIFDAIKIDYKKDFRAEGIKAADAPRMMQDSRIDGFFYTVGHPNGNIKEATAGLRKARIISIPEIPALLENFPYYNVGYIDMASYPEATNAAEGKIPTVSMKATLVTNAAVSEEVVYNVTKAVFESIEELKALHPALADLTKEGMLEGLTAPLHPGSERYYREVGLIKD